MNVTLPSANNWTSLREILNRNSVTNHRKNIEACNS